MPQKTLLTLEQFSAMPDDGRDYELVHGELVEMPPQDYEHEFIKNRISKLLILFLEGKKLGLAFVETGSILDADSWRIPDVGFFRAQRLAGQDRKQPIHGAADLCIEVVSPSNKKRDLEQRTEHFLSTGASAVWIVYPDSREVHIITKAGSHWLEQEDTIEQQDLLPGFSVPVCSIFEEA